MPRSKASRSAGGLQARRCAIWHIANARFLFLWSLRWLSRWFLLGHSPRLPDSPATGHTFTGLPAPPAPSLPTSPHNTHTHYYYYIGRVGRRGQPYGQGRRVWWESGNLRGNQRETSGHTKGHTKGVDLSWKKRFLGNNARLLALAMV